MSETWRLGTRGSRLALYQAHRIRDQILSAELTDQVDCIEIKTLGDREQDRMWERNDPQGVFVTAIEEALVKNEIDLAVHSAKDLPSSVPSSLCLAAFTEREDPHDVLVHPEGLGLDAIPEGSTVGTGSPRRATQLLHMRPDLNIRSIRGNVETRIRKLQEGKCDALVMAAAGLKRLGLDQQIPVTSLSFEICLPAAAQGVLTIETRKQDESLRAKLKALDESSVRPLVETERACLRRLNAGCLAPVAVFADWVEPNELRLRARVMQWDGKRIIAAEARGTGTDSETLASRVASQLIEEGAIAVIEEARAHRDERQPL